MNTNTNKKSVPKYHVREFKKKSRTYCLIVPVINEGERLIAQLERIMSLGLDVDVVVADGGSTDGSVDTENLQSTDVKACLTKIGPGKLSAQLRMAFDYALTQGYKGVISIDGNGKDGVEAIRQMVERLDEGFDFVQASRFIPGGKAENTPTSRLIAIKLIHSPLTSLGARFRFTDSTNGFRGHSSSLLMDDKIGLFRDVFDTYELLAYMPIRAARLGYQCVEIPASRIYPSSGAIPTKIHGLSSQLSLFKILLKAVLGLYNPR
jgi:glycosyltransferase involved in cell wall biosynthesis